MLNYFHLHFRNVKNIQKLSQRELELGVNIKQSWHQQYRDSAWVFLGGLNYELTEGDIICVFSQYGEVRSFFSSTIQGEGREKDIVIFKIWLGIMKQVLLLKVIITSLEYGNFLKIWHRSQCNNCYSQLVIIIHLSISTGYYICMFFSRLWVLIWYETKRLERVRALHFYAMKISVQPFWLLII